MRTSFAIRWLVTLLVLWSTGPAAFGPAPHRAIALRACCRQHCTMAMRGASGAACALSAACCHPHQAVLNGVSTLPWATPPVLTIDAPSHALARAMRSPRLLAAAPSGPAPPPPRG